jgi:integrase
VTAPERRLAIVRAAVPVRQVHADRAAYKSWVHEHCTSYAVRCARMDDYDRFTERWPVLQDWFDAPLRQRLLDKENCVRGQHPHGGASVIMPYLTYLSLVEGVGLDYPVLLARTFTSPFKYQMRYGGLGVDLDLFDRHAARLEQLGYANGAAQLTWPLGRMMLHRGDSDLSALGWDDLREFREAIDGFSARMRLEPLREFYARAPAARPPAEVANGYFASSIARLHAVHVLLFHIGQIQQPPTGRINAGSWVDHLAPDFAPPKIHAVLERYLRLHLQANLDRPQTVRHVRDALRRLVTWMAEAHPEMTSLADLHREHAEVFLCWLGTQTSQHTGAPLSVSFRRSIVTLITRFVTETAAWGWDDVPARVLFSRADIPKITHPVPRFIPDHELAALMAAVDHLPDPYQRAALIVARWSGARRDEIRRLAVDCLDTYPDGHPRLRIPVGKGYAERMIPLHPQAAEALQPVIELARQQNARKRFDPSAGRPVQHVFLVRGKLLSNAFLFDLSLKAACTTAGLVDSSGRPMITAHRFRHTIGTQLAEGGARIQTIMAVLGHRTPNMSIIYSTLSDPTVKQQYQDALDRHLGADVTLAGPAAEALREHRLDPEAVSWLQTNFLKTELELGHCLRTPAEGPCECDLVLTCSKFLTTSDYAPRLRARLDVEQQLIDDATARGWQREIERHTATKTRIEQLLKDLRQ